MSVEVVDRPQTPAELADLIHSYTEFDHGGGEDGYSASADAMWKAALAAFEYASRRVGATGFQAGWAALRFYGEAMGVDGPYMVTQLHEALYPQYDLPGRLRGFIEENRDWLREQASVLLSKYEAKPTYTWTDDDGTEHTHPAVSPHVVAHWRELAAS